jgi:hypothetical protein
MKPCTKAGVEREKLAPAERVLDHRYIPLVMSITNSVVPRFTKVSPDVELDVVPLP